MLIDVQQEDIDNLMWRLEEDSQKHYGLPSGRGREHVNKQVRKIIEKLKEDLSARLGFVYKQGVLFYEDSLVMDCNSNTF